MPTDKERMITGKTAPKSNTAVDMGAPGSSRRQKQQWEPWAGAFIAAAG